MRISNILSTLLFISAATAATIRYPLSPKKIDTTVSKRVTWSHIQGINIWSTARAGSGAVQLTILGGLRLTPVLRDVFGETNYGPTLANAFYLDIMSKIEALHIANIIPVYKDANAPDWGILGLRVDVFAGETPEQNLLNDLLEQLKNYFLDNNRVAIHHMPVSDAFNIGGPFVSNKVKRNDGLGGLEKRQGACMDLDFVSLFRADVPWDPDNEMHGVTPCGVQDGTGKRV